MKWSLWFISRVDHGHLDWSVHDNCWAYDNSWSYSLAAIRTEGKTFRINTTLLAEYGLCITTRIPL